METTEHEEAQEAEAQEPEAHAAQEPPHAAPDAAPEPKRRGRPPGSKNKPKQDVPTEPAAPKRKPKPPPLETAPVDAPEAPAEGRLSSQESSSAPCACWRGSPPTTGCTHFSCAVRQSLARRGCYDDSCRGAGDHHHHHHFHHASSSSSS